MIFKILMTLLLLSSLNSFAVSRGAFNITVNNLSIKVISPKQKSKVVSISIKNDTLENIVSRIKTKDKVLKRFVLPATKKKTFDVEVVGEGSLYYVPISPPFQEVELKFGQRPYEIPEKK